ncbi:MAG: hypothetical protein IT532_05270 [Burkholderiales bacterium]|nr:hypothetical protein [Burkholderiales bacterium]
MLQYGFIRVPGIHAPDIRVPEIPAVGTAEARVGARALASLCVRLLFAAGLLFAGADARAEGIRFGYAHVDPYFHAGPDMMGWYIPFAYGPCHPAGGCLTYGQFRAWERRRERERELGRPPDTPPPMGIEAWHGWPGNAKRRLPEADPDNATSLYGEAGRVKEQYERSGEFLPEFLEGRARPR